MYCTTVLHLVTRSTLVSHTLAMVRLKLNEIVRDIAWIKREHQQQ